MSELKSCKQPEQKKSLINSIDNLQQKASRLNDLKELSYRLVDKMEHPFPEPQPVEEGENGDKEAEKEPDIIDAFDRITSRIDVSINLIKKNIEQVFDMIG